MGGWASSSGRWQTGLLRVTPSVPCAEPRSIPSGAPQGRKSRRLRAGERRVGIGAVGLPGLRQHGPRRPCLGVPVARLPAGRARHLASVCKRVQACASVPARFRFALSPPQTKPSTFSCARRAPGYLPVRGTCWRREPRLSGASFPRDHRAFSEALVRRGRRGSLLHPPMRLAAASGVDGGSEFSHSPVWRTCFFRLGIFAPASEIFVSPKARNWKSAPDPRWEA